jgi:cytochrome P450
MFGEADELQHVVGETLRLYPPVPFNVRLALNDTTLPTGGGPSCEESVGILKDTAIAYSVLTLQRRQDLWPLEGPSLDVFCPERWENFQPQPWGYLPFNSGPRHCMGEDFALMEIKYTVVRILQRYRRIKARLRPQDQFMKTEIVSQPGAGVLVGLFPVEYGANVA